MTLAIYGEVLSDFYVSPYSLSGKPTTDSPAKLGSGAGCAGGNGNGCQPPTAAETAEFVFLTGISADGDWYGCNKGLDSPCFDMAVPSEVSGGYNGFSEVAAGGGAGNLFVTSCVDGDESSSCGGFIVDLSAGSTKKVGSSGSIDQSATSAQVLNGTVAYTLIATPSPLSLLSIDYATATSNTTTIPSHGCTGFVTEEDPLFARSVGDGQLLFATSTRVALVDTLALTCTSVTIPTTDYSQFIASLSVLDGTVAVLVRSTESHLWNKLHFLQLGGGSLTLGASLTPVPLKVNGVASSLLGVSLVA
jgi:hypothetical protein